MAAGGMSVLACCADEVFSQIEDQAHVAPEAVDMQRVGNGVSLARIASGMACRDQARTGTYQTVIVGPGVPDVEPINLAAAVCLDRAIRRTLLPHVILVVDRMVGSLASRAKAAGIDAVVPLTQLDMLGRWMTATMRGDGRDDAGVMTAGAVDAGFRSAAEAASDGRERVAQSVSEGAETKVAVPGGGARTCRTAAESVAATSASADGSRVVCVGSGRGGVGKSSISILLALCARKRGVPTLLVDLDAQFGDLAYLLGVEDPPTTLGALDGAAVGVGIGERAVEVAGGVGFLAAPTLPEQGDILVDQVAPLLDRAREDFALIVCNLGSTWGDLYAEALLAADLTLLVMDQRASSVEACRQAFGLACRLGVAGPRISFVLNRCSQKGQVTGLDASVALDGARVFELPEGGPAVEDLIAAGCPEELLAQSNPFAQGVDDLAGRLLGHLGLAAEAGKAPRQGRSWLFGRG